jgi:subtilase family serine protease
MTASTIEKNPARAFPDESRVLLCGDGSFTTSTEAAPGISSVLDLMTRYSERSPPFRRSCEENGLSAPPSFTVLNLGATATDAGWALETALDVEWAHAIAPDANIDLVEASSDSLAALFGAVSYASNLAGVGVISMSWGTSEFAGETQYDSVFQTPAGHENVTYVAASGDTGASDGVEYPSVSSDVLAVGGTTLTVSSDGTYVSESGWSGSTGGFSMYESEPPYQTSTLESVGLSDGVRTTPDVSFNADPTTGVSVYDSVAYNGQSGWFVIGGTSAAAPAWAGLVAIADQGLATGGVGTLSTTEVLTDLYSLPSADYNDITTGSNGYSATAGYDLVTGRGTPKADQLIAGLLAANGVSEVSTTTTSSDGSSVSTTSSSSSSASSTSSTGTTTSSPSPTSTSHHKKDVSTKKTKTHHTKVQRTKVAKTKVAGTSVEHDSRWLRSPTPDERASE